MVEILLASYNGEKYIAEQIDSLLKQTYQEIKILIRDDNSTDNTLRIVEEYVEKYPNKVFLIKDNIKSRGPQDNFFALLDYASAEYVMFCDQDDVWDVNKVEICVNTIKQYEKKEEKILLFHDYYVVDENLKILYRSKKIKKNELDVQKLITNNVIHGCMMVFNKALMQDLKNIEKKDWAMHDWMCALVAALNGKILYIEEPLVKYRQHENNNVGENASYFAYIKSRWKTMEIKKRINIYYKQVESLLNQKVISNSQKKIILSDFLELKNKGKFFRMIGMVVKGYCSGSFIKKMGLIFFV